MYSASGNKKFRLLWGPGRAKVSPLDFEPCTNRKSQNSSRGVRAKALTPPALLPKFLFPPASVFFLLYYLVITSIVDKVFLLLDIILIKNIQQTINTLVGRAEKGLLAVKVALAIYRLHHRACLETCLQGFKPRSETLAQTGPHSK
ncbi:hypothetical protein CPR19088_GLDEOEPO_01997 [Companilactobacillus paralimentarius]